MIKKTLLIILIILISAPCFAQESTELHGIKTEQKQSENKIEDIILGLTFLGGQVFNTGNMIYAQENGRREINPVYGDHPSKTKIYIIKGLGTIAVLGSAWLLPKYRKQILIPANVVVVGIITNDLTTFGIEMTTEW